jgi:hypothetical protein
MPCLSLNLNLTGEGIRPSPEKIDGLIFFTYNNMAISNINDATTRSILQIAYDGAVEHNLIDFFRDESPPPNTGYMLWVRPELNTLAKYMDSNGCDLSGAVFAMACRLLQSYLRNPEETIERCNNSRR